MASHFQPTRWTLVSRTQGEGEGVAVALSELCEHYYEPIVAFLCREGRKSDEAREVAHNFFEMLIAGGLGKPDPSRGRFRSYLLGALKHYLAKASSARVTQKRGAGAEHLSLTAAGELSSSQEADSENCFDRDWAFALIARALVALEQENSEKKAVFEALKPWLDGNADQPQAEVAERLGISETAVKVAVHRLRVRLRELIRNEVQETVAEPTEVGEELRYLIEIVSAR